jgi:hypothetical protein
VACISQTSSAGMLGLIVTSIRLTKLFAVIRKVDGCNGPRNFNHCEFRRKPRRARVALCMPTGAKVFVPVLAQALRLPQERIVVRTYPMGGGSAQVGSGKSPVTSPSRDHRGHAGLHGPRADRTDFRTLLARTGIRSRSRAAGLIPETSEHFGSPRFSGPPSPRRIVISWSSTPKSRRSCPNGSDSQAPSRRGSATVDNGYALLLGLAM